MKNMVLWNYGMLICLLVLQIRYFKNKSIKSQACLFIVIFCIVEFVPVFKGCTVVEILLGQIGQLSITTMIIICLTLVCQGNPLVINSALNRHSYLVIFILGGLLYLAYFGFLAADIYHYGYFLDNTWIIVIYFILQIYLWKYARIFSYIWLIALFAFIAKIQASNNLWDYLFDTVLWFASFLFIIKFSFNLCKQTIAKISFKHHV